MARYGEVSPAERNARIRAHTQALIDYGVSNGLVNDLDRLVVRNALWYRLDCFGDYSEDVRDKTEASKSVYEILEGLAQLMAEKGESLSYAYERDQFDAEIMGLLMPRNSEINAAFWQAYKVAPKAASDYFYALSRASTYIRTDRTSKNKSWTAPSPYGALDITINLSKPEKTPEEIALQRSAPSSTYPKCLLCKENAGFPGTVSHPSRWNHRLVQMQLDGEPWYLQYSPYVYYPEHAIVLCHDHRPMCIDRRTFVRLVDFLDIMPHYFIGSNADLHTVGGSILSHDHYQAGHYEMPMMRARHRMTFYGEAALSDVDVAVLDWPLTVISLQSTSRDALLNAAHVILETWKRYDCPDFELLAYSEGERHNTVTPIARKRGDVYELFLALRNNRQSPEHPMGIFHPHAEHHHMKKENIGLIEVMGLAVLPGRLVLEIEALIDAIETSVSAGKIDADRICASELLNKHLEWIRDISGELETAYPGDVKSRRARLNQTLQALIGLKFSAVLEDCGVFKGDIAAVTTFLKQCDLGLYTAADSYMTT